MEHPLINDISNLTVDQLQEKISELNKKLAFAQRSRNADLVGQIRMAIETFTNRYQQKTKEMYDSKNKNDPDYSDKINIS
jgi:hypothetical protein